MSYREGAENDHPRHVSFLALSPETRRRLCATLHQQEHLLLAEGQRVPGGHWGWAALGVLGLSLAVFALGHRFGDLSVSPRSPAVVGLLAGAGLAAALLAPPLFVLWRRATALPRGVFVLAFDLVDTRSDTVAIFPLARILRARNDPDGSLRIEFEGGVVFVFSSREPAGQLLERVADAQRQAAEAAEREGVQLTEQIDPFVGERGRWPANSLPQASPSVPWRRWSVAAVAAGLALGQLLAPLALRASDARGLARAEQEADDDALLSYLQRGGPLAVEADEIRWTLARRIQGDGGLFHYLRTGRRHRDEADALLVEALQRNPEEQRLLRYLDAGGREQDWADRLLLQLAVAQGAEASLQAYLQRGGKAVEEVEQVLLPRLQIKQAARSKNLGLLRLLASPSERLSAKQLVDRGQFPAKMQEEALITLEALWRDELKRATDDATQRAMQQAVGAPEALWLLLELAKKSDPWRCARVALSVRAEELSGSKKVLRPSWQQARGFPKVVEEVLGELLPSSLLQVSSEDTPDGRVELVYDMYSASVYSHKLQGRLIVEAQGKRAELPFQSTCRPWSRLKVEQILKRALAGALRGDTKEDCSWR